MLELLPQVSPDTRALVCDLILTTLSSVGKDFPGAHARTQKLLFMPMGWLICFALT